MKKSTIYAVLFRKVRIKITRRKRGRFRVVIPAGFQPEYGEQSETFSRKQEALVWLFTKIRCLEPMVIRVDCVE